MGRREQYFEDLRFLQYFPRLKRFQADAWHITDVEGLRFLPPDLHTLGIGGMRKKSLSLSVLRCFPNLRDLYIDGLTKDYRVLGELHDLETLTLRCVTLPDLSCIAGLTNLKRLHVKLGGTRNLRGISNLALEHVEIVLVRLLDDLTPLEGMRSLIKLRLDSLRNVSALPDCTGLVNLRCLDMRNMSSVRDLTPLLKAPVLEELDIVNARNMQPEDFLPLRAHRTLTQLGVGFGSKKKNLRLAGVMGWRNEVEEWTRVMGGGPQLRRDMPK
jgi:hypothetical protein